jgi:hypothetical protein
MPDRCTVCAEHTTVQKLFLTHRMELLGDVGRVESYFIPFGDTDNLDARLVHGLRQTYHSLRSHYGRTGWNSNLISVHFETVLV